MTTEVMTAEFVWNNDTVRRLERSSIRLFMEENRQYLRGRVLDFGAGKQPYRDLVEGEYVPLEQGDRWPDGSFDAVMCNQVMQYLGRPRETLFQICYALKSAGALVMTYPTNWDELEPTDFWRFTRFGMERLLTSVGLEILKHERRAEINLNGFRFPLGYGVIAQKR